MLYPFFSTLNNTHNFIHGRVAIKTHCYVKPTLIFQIMIDNGGMMKCGVRCEHVKLLVDYHLKYHMFSIDMGGYVILDVEWYILWGRSNGFEGIIYEIH